MSVNIYYGITDAQTMRDAIEANATLILVPPAGGLDADERIPLSTKTCGRDWFRLTFKGAYYTYTYDSATGWTDEPNMSGSGVRESDGVSFNDLSPQVRAKIDNAYEIPNPTLSDVGSVLTVKSVGGFAIWGISKISDPGDFSALKSVQLDIAAGDWVQSEQGYTCNKTVTGMTETAVVWVEYSDMTNAYTCTQGTDSLIFACNTLPSETISIKVAFASVAN